MNQCHDCQTRPSSIAIIVKTTGQYAVQPFAESIKVTLAEHLNIQCIPLIVSAVGPQKTGTISNRHYIR